MPHMEPLHKLQVDYQEHVKILIDIKFQKLQAQQLFERPRARTLIIPS